MKSIQSIVEAGEEIVRAHTKTMDGQERPLLVVALRRFLRKELEARDRETAKELIETVIERFETHGIAYLNTLESIHPHEEKGCPCLCHKNGGKEIAWCGLCEGHTKDLIE